MATGSRAGRRGLDEGRAPGNNGGGEVGGGGLRLAVLGGFQLLSEEDPVRITPGSARLLAFLALARRSVNRLVVATSLWPNASEEHAYGNLRATLGRLRGTSRAAVRVDPAELGIAAQVRVDLNDARALAHRLLDPVLPPTGADVSLSAVSVLSCELLCDWYEDWVIVEAEDWRQLRLHALEALAGHLSRNHQFGHATVAALAAIRAEPLRESSHVALIRVHLAEDNRSEAVREFERYRALLLDELGLEPSGRLRELVGR